MPLDAAFRRRLKVYGGYGEVVPRQRDHTFLRTALCAGAGIEEGGGRRNERVERRSTLRKPLRGWPGADATPGPPSSAAGDNETSTPRPRGVPHGALARRLRVGAGRMTTRSAGGRPAGV